jgi:pSer/pThr/pTyr-binding forkhead associated (FHA) protein
MWKLTIEDDEGKQTQLPLAHEEYGVGRAESNAIRLTDRNISRNHASLKKNGQGWSLKDHSSYNGTYVNGVRVVGEQPIHAGEIIQLGDYRLELVDEVAVAQAAPGAAPQPALPPVHQRPNRLVVVVGPQPGAEFPLDKEHFTVGRSEDADISINHSSVSRLHAELFALGNGRYEIVDKASANGIRINGVELKRGILEAGDALELGDVRLRFVGQGKIFRADMTQQLAAVQGFDAGKGGKGLSVGKLIGIGVAVGVAIIVGLIVLFTHGSGTVDAQGKKRVVTAESKGQLLEAMKIFNAGDVDGAHGKLRDIPDENRPADDPDFKKIEDAWADKKFKAADDPSADLATRKGIYQEIANDDMLDPAQRKRALQRISEIAPKAPPPPPTPVYNPNYVPPPASTPTATATATATATVIQGGPAPQVPDEDKIRRSLEPKMRSGRASLEELRMLKAICSHQGDHACRNAAAAAIAAKSGN